MSSVLRKWKQVGLSVACAAGMMGFAGFAQAQTQSNTQSNAEPNEQPNAQVSKAQSKTVVRDAQQQLQKDGFYKGKIDGIDGPKTHSAIRKFQQQNNLAVNGRLDKDTLDKMGVQSTGEAARAQTETPGAPAAKQKVSATTVKAVQQQLQQKGLYHGKVNGVMNSKTQAAIRQYQQQNNLNVTGTLDQQTLNSLGVSPTGTAPGPTQ